MMTIVYTLNDLNTLEQLTYLPIIRYEQSTKINFYQLIISFKPLDRDFCCTGSVRKYEKILVADIEISPLKKYGLDHYLPR